MLFSKKCEYAIRAAVYLAAESDTDNKIGIAQICNNIKTPLPFTAKILQVLTRNNIISSQKGVNGGFYMDGDQQNQPLLKIIVALEEKESLYRCGLGLRNCSEKTPCPLHDKYKKIRTDIMNMLDNFTIAMMAKKLKKGDSFLKV